MLYLKEDIHFQVSTPFLHECRVKIVRGHLIGGHGEADTVSHEQNFRLLE